MEKNWLDPRAVGDLISEARHKAGLTQETLSGLAGIGRTHLSAIERGLRLPNLETLFHICYALNIDAAILIKEIEKSFVIKSV